MVKNLAHAQLTCTNCKADLSVRISLCILDISVNFPVLPARIAAITNEQIGYIHAQRGFGSLLFTFSCRYDCISWKRNQNGTETVV